MSGQQILTAARLNFSTENGCLILILASLIFAETFVEKEFQCICRKIYRETIFSFYLGIPAIIVYTVTFCILCELKRQESNKKRNSDEETQNQESDTEQRSTCVLGLKSLIPSCFWILLFFCDGRYVACIATTLKGERADNTAPPPWEWCNKNRTLTDDQKTAEIGYIGSKIAGFAALLLSSIIILVYECCKQRKQRNAVTQPRTGHGTASTLIGAEQGTDGAEPGIE